MSFAWRDLKTSGPASQWRAVRSSRVGQSGWGQEMELELESHRLQQEVQYWWPQGGTRGWQGSRQISQTEGRLGVILSRSTLVFLLLLSRSPLRYLAATEGWKIWRSPLSW